MEELWEKWYPAQKLAPKYQLVDLSYDLEGFIVTLAETRNTTNILIISFENTIDNFKKTSFYNYPSLKALEKIHGLDFQENWAFFTVKNSSYLQWSYQESLDTMPVHIYKHRVIITSEGIIDILAAADPLITYKSNNNEGKK